MNISWNAYQVDKDAENRAKSGEIIDATTSPVDKMNHQNTDRSLQIQFPFFVAVFLFL